MDRARLELIRDLHQQRQRAKAAPVVVDPAWRSAVYRQADRQRLESTHAHERIYANAYERVLFAVLNGLSEVLKSPPPGC